MRFVNHVQLRSQARMRFVNHVNYGLANQLANQPFALSDDCGFKDEKSKRTHGTS
jgi:hypothetical protein